MNDYRPRWFLRTISYKQTRLAPVSYKKIAAWNFYLLLKFGQDCFAEVCIFLFLYFSIYCMNVYHAIPDNIKRFQQAESNIIPIIQTNNLKFSSGNYISPVGHPKAT